VSYILNIAVGWFLVCFTSCKEKLWKERIMWLRSFRKQINVTWTRVKCRIL